MRSQVITQEQARDLFTYSNGKLYWKNSTRTGWNGRKAGTMNHDLYWHVNVKNVVFRLHRVIFVYHHGYLPEFIDHIDGNRSNNLIDNLRPATKSQNQHNSKMPTNNTSGVKGVYWNTGHKKWVAQIKLNNKRVFLGYFSDIKEAERVVVKARKELHKEFANNGTT